MSFTNSNDLQRMPFYQQAINNIDTKQAKNRYNASNWKSIISE